MAGPRLANTTYFAWVTIPGCTIMGVPVIFLKTDARGGGNQALGRGSQSCPHAAAGFPEASSRETRVQELGLLSLLRSCGCASPYVSTLCLVNLLLRLELSDYLLAGQLRTCLGWQMQRTVPTHRRAEMNSARVLLRSHQIGPARILWAHAPSVPLACAQTCSKRITGEPCHPSRYGLVAMTSA